MKRLQIWMVLTFVLMVISACALPLNPAVTRVTEQEPAQTDEIGMPNPASQFCEKNGGREENRQDVEGNQYGVCIFEDGSECDSWQFFRGECQSGQTVEESPSIGGNIYSNEAYGFSFTLPEGWTTEEADHKVMFRKGDYLLIIGYRSKNEERIIFRTGIPAGDILDSGTIPFVGQELPKKVVIDMNGSVTRLIDYGSEVGVGNLRLSMWLEIKPLEGVAKRDHSIPPEIQAQADQIISSFILLSGETPSIELN
jgi:putative hemolysin